MDKQDCGQTSSADSAVVSSYAQTQTGGNQQNTQNNSLQAGNATQGQGMRTIVGVFSSHSAAEQAITQLRQQGFTQEEISIISKKGKEQGDKEFYDDDVTDGALTGGTIGGIGGLLLGAGALAIPGVGPILAAGPIAAALSGAVAGGVAGGLIDWGIPSEASHRYEQNVAQGDILAIIQTQASKVDQAAQLLRQNGAKDVQSHNAK